VIESLSAHGSVITIRSYLTGESPLASWNGEDLHLYVVASLALVLAVPQRGWAARAKLAGTAFAVVALGSLAICVVQLEGVAQAAAATLWQIRLYTAREMAWIEWINRVLISLGMLLFPASLFLVAYLRVWAEPARVPGAEADLVALPRAATRGRRLGVGVLVLAAAAGLFLFAGRRAGERAGQEAWARILSLNPDFAPALVNVGLHLEERGQLDEAIDLYRRALGGDPDLVAAHYNLGNALHSKGLAADAVRSYEDALRLDAGHAAAQRNLGVALLDLGRPCEALGAFERSTALDATYRETTALAAEIARLRAQCAPPREPS